MAVEKRTLGKPAHEGGDEPVIFQGSHMGDEKGCGRRGCCVGGAAKAHVWSGLRREGLAQEEKERWRVGRLRVRGVKT